MKSFLKGLGLAPALPSLYKLRKNEWIEFHSNITLSPVKGMQHKQGVFQMDFFLYLLL